MPDIWEASNKHLRVRYLCLAAVAAPVASNEGQSNECGPEAAYNVIPSVCRGDYLPGLCKRSTN
eukprot:5239297-Pyramimonas_sp.AAC.2